MEHERTPSEETVDPLAETRAPTRSEEALAQTALGSVGDAALTETAVDDARPVTAKTALATGERLGRYTQLAKLGAGAMGVVYSAQDGKLGRKVALKVLKRPDAELTERLKREARAMAQVTHPNVVAVYEADEADEVTYIAMELVDGASLRAWQTQPRQVVEILEAYAAAGRGLAAAHAAGIVHRDFKPDNVLVGSDGRVRVTDFGLAAGRASTGEGGGAGAVPDDVSLTAVGSVLGTPAYMAPEQFTGGNVDPRTDQFCFCVALYEALYGKRPFAGKSFTELGDAVCDGKIAPPPPRSRVSSALRAILLRGLSVKPGDRFPTMDHLIAELGRDRARPWRRSAFALGAVAAALALWLVADVALRDRAAVAVAAAYRLTGKQIGRALKSRQDAFDEQAAALSHEPALVHLISHRDDADFGLEPGQRDVDDLEAVHGEIESSDWAFNKRARASADAAADVFAIIDAKGRLIYSTATPTWGGSVAMLPQVKHAIDTGAGESVELIAYEDPALRAAGVLGGERTGLALLYSRAISLGADGDKNVKEARGVVLEIRDGERLLEDISLDESARLALVDTHGLAIGSAPAELLAAAPVAGGGAAQADTDGQTYQLQAIAVPGLEAQGAIGTVVMANPIGGLTLFPHARLVLALLLVLALGSAGATGLRARQIARA